MGLAQIPQRRILQLTQPLRDNLFAIDVLIIEDKILQLLARS